jgi:phage-related protein
MLLWMYQHVENLLSLIDNMEKKAKTETKKQQISIVKKRATDLLNKLKNLSNKK